MMHIPTYEELLDEIAALKAEKDNIHNGFLKMKAAHDEQVKGRLTDHDNLLDEIDRIIIQDRFLDLADQDRLLEKIAKLRTTAKKEGK